MKIEINEKANLSNVFKSGTMLSAKAIGVYVVLLKADTNKKYTGIREYLQSYVTDGNVSIKSGLDELIEKGFLVKTAGRLSHGAFCETKYIVTVPERV